MTATQLRPFAPSLLLGTTLSRALTGLEARGLHDRAKAPDDARRAVIAICRSGLALVADVVGNQDRGG